MRNNFRHLISSKKKTAKHDILRAKHTSSMRLYVYDFRLRKQTYRIPVYKLDLNFFHAITGTTEFPVENGNCAHYTIKGRLCLVNLTPFGEPTDNMHEKLIRADNRRV